MRAVSLKLPIDQRRHSLIGGRPVHVAATEDGEGQTRSGIRRRCGVGDPAAKAFGVVRWVAVVGRAHHHQRSLVGQFAGVIIEGSQRDGITAVGSVLGNAAGNALRSPQIGPEQHHERRVMSLPGPLWPRLGLGGLPVGRRGGDGDRVRFRWFGRDAA